MRTDFLPELLEDPDMQRSDQVLRSCVHCGFCTATCPTYQLLGDELDSPRGRIYLIKDMLETNRPADAETVRHIDRCLSCLGCMTTCPSGVHFAHLVDHARAHIEDTFRRPLADRVLRVLVAWVLPHPARFRLALRAAQMTRAFRWMLPTRLKALYSLVPNNLPPASSGDKPGVGAASGKRVMRVALLTGCAQQVLNPDINDATRRILRRHGVEVIVPKDVGCCGALTHHMGKTQQSHDAAARNINAWFAEMSAGGLDAIVVNASGCGTTVKDYGHMFRATDLAEKAGAVAALGMDITEVLNRLELSFVPTERLRVAHHSACSLQHGQKIHDMPKSLLEKAGFSVVEPADAHLCCGSAGTYNILQPTLSNALRDRKLTALNATAPDVVAAGNIGCMMQLRAGSGAPIVHTVELLDWATGGPKPRAIG